MQDETSPDSAVFTPRSPGGIAREVVAILGSVCCIAIATFYWTQLPDSIPIHFGITGKPDLWGNKLLIVLFPALAVVIYLWMTVIMRFSRQFNYPVAITAENAAKQYQIARDLLSWMKTEIIWMFAWIEWQMVQVAVGRSQTLDILGVFAFVSLILGTTGIYLWQAYRNR
ncbi:DUF1648 domain-containing protein [Phormidium sp. CCY1219]|uniref:DUF1648 domain-containing protein n=1 Tax=Phormidium sp. CCY1219 TaxID=2886104 RepID=UPI002D1E70B0|nr:DUF1648 domain-containing protein [Phormidium sp. CCY1219]MEB3827919.1 DUF1648 domain-containing protein [Phormidium sp. CCY1219]